jgi:hypothetical protein
VVSHAFHTEVLDIDGFMVRVNYWDDYDQDPPWVRDDGHGSIRFVRSRDMKRPGERPMRSDSRELALYDWQGACKKAREEQWGPGAIEEAVQADFDFLQGFLMNNWSYVGITVTLELFPQYEDTCGGFESYNDYHEEGARDRAKELVRQYLDDIEKGALLCSETPTDANAS